MPKQSPVDTRSAARKRHHTVDQVHAVVFETHSRLVFGEHDEDDADDSIDVRLETDPSYAVRPDGTGISIRLRTTIERPDCALLVDCALHYVWSTEHEWDDPAISAYMGLAMTEVFGYQRPLFDQMVQSLDLPRTTLTTNEFMEAARSSLKPDD